MLHMGNRLELFVDHLLIDQLRNVQLRLHRPNFAGIALKFDRLWEGPSCGYCTMIRDSGRYRLYYRGWADPDDKHGAATCLAESDDGIHFSRPNLGLHEVAGSRDNNVFLVGAGTHNFSPFLDTRPGVADDQRYKALASVRDPENEKAKGLGAFVSADGVSWKRMTEGFVFTRGAFDSQNVSFWSEHEQCYVAYYRTWADATPDNPQLFKGKRTISRATSDDYIHWSDGEPMDFGDAPAEELYTNQTHPYFRAPHIYIALPKRFTPKRRVLTDAEIEQFQLVNPRYAEEVSDGMFMTSRGGNRYDRTFMEAFVRNGLDRNNWVSRTNLSTLNVVPTGDGELSLYYQHRYATAGHYLARYTLRTDGFTSIEAPYAGGEMLTRPFTFAGTSLVINYATSAPGGIKVELQDESGKPIPGFTLDDADEIFGDEIERTVTWKGSGDLSALNGKPIRTRFVMRDANLYSIRFV